MKKVLSSLVLIFVTFMSIGQISVTQTQTPDQLVNNVLSGAGVAISNVKYNYSIPDAQITQTTVSYFNNNGTSFPINEGVILATGDAVLAVGPNTSGSSTNNNGVAVPDPSDPDLAAISTAVINNECILEFDFVPNGDTIVFNYIFASEEYPEFSPSNYNDAFGFFISGPGFAGPFSNGAENIAIIPGTTTPVTINNINPTTNQSLYVSNAGGADLQYDGHTVVLQAAASVICGQTYHIKLAIGDAGDQSYDSAVFLEANSFSSNGADISILPLDSNGDPLVNNELYEGCTSAQIVMVNPVGYTDSSFVVNINTSGTATNGVDYSTINSTYTIPPGQDSLFVTINTLFDGVPEGTETLIIGTYYVNECGDTITVNDTINILDVAPNFNTTIMNDTVFTCASASFDVSAMTDGGVPSLTYDWGVLGTNQTATIPANVPGTTTYSVTVTDACGIVSNSSFDVTLNPAPIPSLTFDNDQNTICPGQNTSFEVVQITNSYDPGNETYNWYNPVGLSNTNTITVSPNVQTWYYVDVFDGCNTVTDSVRVIMGGVDLTAINVVDALNCPGQPAPVLGEIEILPAVGGWTYQITGGGSTVGPQAGNQFTNLTGGLTYFITVTDANNCFTDTNIFVGSAVTATTADWVISYLDSVTCNGDADGSAQIQNIQGGINSGPYDITWTNQTGNMASLTGVFNGTGSTVDTLNGGLWVVSVVEQGSGCAWSQAFTIYEPAPLFVDFANSSNPTCFESNDGDITIAVGGGNVITQVNITNSAGTLLNSGVSDLTVNNLIQGTYSVELIDNKGCTTNQGITLTHPDEIAIDFTLVNPQCYGQEVGNILIDTVYNYQNTVYDSIYYIWQPDPNTTSGYGADLGNYIRFIGEGDYTVKIIDGNNCFKFFDFTIDYPDSIYWDELAVLDQAICRDQNPFDNGNGQIYAAATGGGDGNGNGTTFSYSWLEVSTGTIYNNPTWGNRNPGWYTVIATNDLGCILRDSLYLDSLSPQAIFTVTSPEFTSPYEGTAVVNTTITNQSLNYAFSQDPSADTTFVWTFGIAGETPYVGSDINEVINKPYLSEGVYEICLVVIENLNGCRDTACQEIIVHDVPNLATPNVFTPGNDGINDVFFFPNQAITTFNCQVFNAWGGMVFEFNDINDTWDGTSMNNGNPCVDGTYFYIYTGESTNGTQYSGQGNIQLIND